MKKLFFVCIFLCGWYATPVFASLVITEIMYDAEGSDSGKEWIEIWNSGDTTEDATLWKFNEGGTRHGIAEYRGGISLPANSYAIIANDPSKFISDNPPFSGQVFDSSFSLSNTGETLSLTTPENVEVSSVTYSSDMGGAGDGNSLQKNGESWVSGIPTLGALYQSSSANNSEPNSNLQNTSSSTAQSTNSQSTQVRGSAWPVDPQIFSRIKASESSITGAEFFVQGEAVGLKKEPLPSARFIWSFGDGGKAEGISTSHAYQFPGDYLIYLEVSSGDFTASSRQKVTVFPPDISIPNANQDFIEIKNHTSRELNLSGWSLSSQGSFFVIPYTTIVLANSSVKFPAKITKLYPQGSSDVNLLYQNGVIVPLKSTQTIIVKNTNTVEKTAPVVVSEREDHGVPIRNDEQENFSSETIQVASAISSIEPISSTSSEKIEEKSRGYFLYIFIVFVVLSASSMFIIKRAKPGPADDITIIE